jgi:Tfp pilus assembly protein PilO
MEWIMNKIMNEIMKVILGGFFGVLIAVAAYEKYLMPNAINLALKNAELTTLKSEQRNKQLIDFSIQKGIEIQQQIDGIIEEL